MSISEHIWTTTSLKTNQCLKIINRQSVLSYCEGYEVKKGFLKRYRRLDGNYPNIEFKKYVMPPTNAVFSRRIDNGQYQNDLLAIFDNRSKTYDSEDRWFIKNITHGIIGPGGRTKGSVLEKLEYLSRNPESDYFWYEIKPLPKEIDYQTIVTHLQNGENPIPRV